MAEAQIIEGKAPFKCPIIPAGRECFTFFVIHGDLNCGKRPLIVVNGGPGMHHGYILPALGPMAARTGIPVVFYDQIGSGRSTHFPEKRLDESFWTIDLLLSELNNLISHLNIQTYDLLGHSAGGMCAMQWALSPKYSQAKGLNKLVIASAPSSVAAWQRSTQELLAGMSGNIQAIIRNYSSIGEYDNLDYKAAAMEVAKKHLCRCDPWPEALVQGFEDIEKDDAMYVTMNGPDELNVIGTMREFNVEDTCQNINVSTMIIHGEFDECTESAVQTLFDKIQKVKWITVPGQSHCGFLEDPVKYTTIVYNFIKD